MLYIQNVDPLEGKKLKQRRNFIHTNELRIGRQMIAWHSHFSSPSSLNLEERLVCEYTNAREV